VNSQFVEDAVDVVFDGGSLDEQPVSDLFVRETLVDELDYLPLARG
jgi:hypothetical protein